MGLFVEIMKKKIEGCKKKNVKVGKLRKKKKRKEKEKESFCKEERDKIKKKEDRGNK